MHFLDLAWSGPRATGRGKGVGKGVSAQQAHVVPGFAAAKISVDPAIEANIL